MPNIIPYAVFNENGEIYRIDNYDSDDLPAHKPGRLKPLEKGEYPTFDAETHTAILDGSPAGFDIQEDKVVQNYKLIELGESDKETKKRHKMLIDLTDPDTGKVQTITIRELIKLLGFG